MSSMDYFNTPDGKLDIPLVSKLVELGNTDEYKEWAAVWKEVQKIEHERLKPSTEVHRLN